MCICKHIYISGERGINIFTGKFLQEKLKNNIKFFSIYNDSTQFSINLEQCFPTFCWPRSFKISIKSLSSPFSFLNYVSLPLKSDIFPYGEKNLNSNYSYYIF